MYLIASIASDIADNRLDRAGGRVDVGLKGRSVLVRHICG